MARLYNRWHLYPADICRICDLTEHSIAVLAQRGELVSDDLGSLLLFCCEHLTPQIRKKLQQDVTQSQAQLPIAKLSGGSPMTTKAAKKAARIEDGSFYCLRHTFNTIGRQTGDQGAVKVIMGHVDGTISEVYDHDVDEEHSINPDRLIKVAKAVRDWLGLTRREAKTCPSPLD